MKLEFQFGLENSSNIINHVVPNKAMLDGFFVQIDRHVDMIIRATRVDNSNSKNFEIILSRLLWFPISLRAFNHQVHIICNFL